MANEITITSSLSFAKDAVTQNAEGLSQTNAQSSVGGNTFVRGNMQVPTAGTAIPLGGVTVPGWAQFKNLDPMNYIQIFSDATMTKCLCRLKGGDPMAQFPLDDTAVPYAKANTAICSMDYLIISR